MEGPCVDEASRDSKGPCCLGVLLALAAPAAAEPIGYSITGPIAFNDLGIVGTINPVNLPTFESFDFSGAGELPGATAGQHVCNNSLTSNPGFFGACSGAMNEILAYSITLDGSSDPMRGVAPFLTGAGSATVAWAGFIVGDGSTNEPDGELFVSGGRGVVFENFSDINDESLYLQPGETSAVLLTAYTTPPGLGLDLSEGATLSFRIFRGQASGNPGTFDVGPVPVAVVPEPGTAGLLAVGLVLLAAKRSRDR